jgi:phosphoribosyl 1,2-cyclic phosphodiesterase
MKFAMMASGSKGNAFLLKDAGTCVLIDCGSTKKYLSGSLETLGVTKDEIDGLVLTHDHSDHVSQLHHFLDSSIYSPVEIPDVDTFHIRPLQKFTIETLQFTPIPLSHDALNTTGYVIENGNEKLVYVTDTGYLNEKYLCLMKGADYIVMESNHDVEMLMRTRRPQYLKQRIYGDEGHLNNEDCADILDRIVTENTKMIVLAHISQQANTREKALEVSRNMLEEHQGKLNPHLILSAAGQFEMIRKGDTYEEVDPGTVYWTAGMGHCTECDPVQ